MEIVRNPALLRKFRQLGFVVFHEHTLKSVWWNGQKHISYYLDEVQLNFYYNFVQYERLYVDGCFMPYVVVSDIQDRFMEQSKGIYKEIR